MGERWGANSSLPRARWSSAPKSYRPTNKNRDYDFSNGRHRRKSSWPTHTRTNLQHGREFPVAAGLDYVCLREEGEWKKEKKRKKKWFRGEEPQITNTPTNTHTHTQRKKMHNLNLKRRKKCIITHQKRGAPFFIFEPEKRKEIYKNTLLPRFWLGELRWFITQNTRTSSFFFFVFFHLLLFVFLKETAQ